MALADYALATAGGIMSFLSPCVLPLVPVYLSVSTGLAVPELEAGGRGRAAAVFKGGGLFVAGFTSVFVALGSSATALGALLARHQVPLTRGGGVLVAALGLVLLASTRSAGGPLSRNLRFHLSRGRMSPWRIWGPAASGAALALGWTPCIGPVLGSVLTVAARQDHAVQGGALLLLYSAGLGIPLLLTGLAFSWSMRALRPVRRWSEQLVRGSALVLTAYGAVLAFDRMAWVTAHLQQAALGVHLGALVTLG